VYQTDYTMHPLGYMQLFMLNVRARRVGSLVEVAVGIIAVTARGQQRG